MKQGLPSNIWRRVLIWSRALCYTAIRCQRNALKIHRTLSQTSTCLHCKIQQSGARLIKVELTQGDEAHVPWDVTVMESYVTVYHLVLITLAPLSCIMTLE